MFRKIVPFLGLTAVIAVGFAVYTAGLDAADLKSGPQVGDEMNIFHPENINGPAAGKTSCLI